MTDMPARVEAVAALTSLPLYQLSTAGMELFHTNALYWLALHRPDESAPLWDALGLRTVRVPHQPPFIRREWRHVDLVVSAGRGHPVLVVENKIGAIPTAEQLGRCRRDVKTHLGQIGDPADFVLLTLTPPSFDLPRPWRSITYQDLLPALGETAGQLSGQDAAFASAYVELVERLDEVARSYDPAASLHEAVTPSPAEREVLLDARLLSLVERVRVGRFAELTTRAIFDENGDVDGVGTGLTNGSGFTEWFTVGPSGRRFGWQIQGRQFRLAVVTGPRGAANRAKREQLVQDSFAGHFDFMPPDHLRGALEAPTARKAWLGYEPDFVYRYAEIAPATTWAELIELAVWFTMRTRDFVAKAG